MYKRKTRDVWWLMSNYGYGWECEVTYDNLNESVLRELCRKGMGLPTGKAQRAH